MINAYQIQHKISKDFFSTEKGHDGLGKEWLHSFVIP